MTTHADLLKKLEEISAVLRGYPYCIKWGTPIPSLVGPYDGGWEAHNSCPSSKHGLFCVAAPAVE